MARCDCRSINILMQGKSCNPFVASSASFHNRSPSVLMQSLLLRLVDAGALHFPSARSKEDGAAPGIEPGTSRTRSENHATRPSSHLIFTDSRIMSAIKLNLYSHASGCLGIAARDRLHPRAVLNTGWLRPTTAGEEESNPCVSPHPMS